MKASLFWLWLTAMFFIASHFCPFIFGYSLYTWSGFAITSGIVVAQVLAYNFSVYCWPLKLSHIYEVYSKLCIYLAIIFCLGGIVNLIGKSHPKLLETNFAASFAALFYGVFFYSLYTRTIAVEDESSNQP